jgi:hypothetical protein
MSAGVICAPAAGRAPRSAGGRADGPGPDLPSTAPPRPWPGSVALVKERGWEGLVAKDPAAPYIGGTTQRWLKVKVRREGRFIVSTAAVCCDDATCHPLGADPCFRVTARL